MMRNVLVLGFGAGLLFGAGQAVAAECTAQIESLEKTLASTDAGMGPTGNGAAASGTADGTAGVQAQNSQPQDGQAPDGQPTDPIELPATGGDQQAAAPTTPGGTEQHPPTETMTDATQNKATSAQDVLQQNQGEPTDSDAAQAGQMATAAGIDEASDALQRAKELDRAGDEAACMSEITKAKGALQIQ